MKRTTIYAIAFVMVFITAGNVSAQKFDNAVAYFEYIGKEFKQVSGEMWDYTSAASHGKSARKVENKRKELIAQINSSIAKVKSMPPFEGNTAYRDSVVSYFKLNKLILNEDYAKIVNMEEIAEQSYDAMEAYMLVKEKADEKQQAAGEMIDEEERKFAAENHITLIEAKDKIGKKLEEAAKVYKYYNEVYLIFFKSYKQEFFLIEAQNKKDLNAMEQNKNALAQTSKEGKAKLTAIKDYKGDLSVKMACLELLNFYEKEAAKFDQVSAYYVQKEKFDKISAAFNAKSPSSRTKEDVDQYNAAVNEMNAASNKFNTVNQELNQNRSRLLNNWNEASAKMIDKHVPKRR